MRNRRETGPRPFEKPVGTLSEAERLADVRVLLLHVYGWHDAEAPDDAHGPTQRISLLPGLPSQ